MKNYKFKLETVLRMKKFAEEKVRNDLGRLYSEKNKMLDKIKTQKNEIHSIYQEQEARLKSGVAAQQLSHYPQMIQAKETLIKMIENDLKKMDQFIKIKNDELIQKKADLKIFEKMKEDDYKKAKADFNKKQDHIIEEQQMFWRESMIDRLGEV